jgi:hypothetical protein
VTAAVTSGFVLLVLAALVVAACAVGWLRSFDDGPDAAADQRLMSEIRRHREDG